MNNLSICGFVKYLKPGQSVTAFKLSVNRGKRGEKDGRKRFLLPVKVFGDASNITEGCFVELFGELDSHEYDGRTIYEVLCNSRNVTIKEVGTGTQNNAGFPPGYPLPPNDERGFRPRY